MFYLDLENLIIAKYQIIDTNLRTIANKISTSNHELVNFDRELQNIRNAYQCIEVQILKRLGKSKQRQIQYDGSFQILASGTKSLSPINRDDVRHQDKLNKGIERYNTILSEIGVFKSSGKQTPDLKEAIGKYTYDFANTLDASDRPNDEFADFIELIRRQANSRFTLGNRIQPVSTGIDLFSYLIGYQSATFFIEYSKEGAPYMHIPDWLAVAGGLGLNAFLNGYFFSVFMYTLKNGIKGIFTNDSDELRRLKRLEPSCNVRLKRGLESLARVAFSGILSLLSVIPFSVLDWQDYGSLFRVIIVTATYEGLHWSGAEAVRLFLLDAFKAFCFPLYRCCRYSTEDYQSYELVMITRNIKAAFTGQIRSGFKTLLENEIEVNQQQLSEIHSLIAKDNKTTEETIQLFFRIMQLAIPHNKDYLANQSLRVILQLTGLICLFMTVSGYALNSREDVARFLHIPEDSIASHIANEIVITSFLGLYLRISWDLVGGIYDSTVGKPVRSVCDMWYNTATWGDFFHDITVGNLKTLYRGVASYFSYVSQTWRHKDSILGWLSQQGTTIKGILLPPEVILALASATTPLYLNAEYLSDDLFTAFLVPTIIMAGVANSYPVNRVLTNIANKFFRFTACSEHKKSEIMLQDLRDFTLSLINETHEFNFIKILISIIQFVKNSELSEKIIANFFNGYSPAELFGKLSCDSATAKAKYNIGIANLYAQLRIHGLFAHQRSADEETPLLSRPSMSIIDISR